MYKIISDGGCDFSKAEAKQFNVEVVPFYITFDGETFMKEGVDITTDDYFARLIADKTLHPKTSQPNPQDYIDAYTPHLDAGHDILSLTISSKLSGSFASATLAANMLKEDYPERTITVLDSQNVCIGQGLILQEISKMRDAGYSLEKTVETAQKVLESTRVYVTLDTLEYLKRGGRVGPTTAFVGGILGLRPILQVENGQVSQLDNVRGKARAIKLMQEAMVEALSGETQNLNISIGHILSQAEAETFKAGAEASLNTKIANPITKVGVAIGTHAGPGALAFAYCRKFDAVGEARKVA
ncbi:MAG: DegV family protein [Defluviitaleaceae bacterium]|nr:DegV family protein [Defluviitaleaceae bacterium]